MKQRNWLRRTVAALLAATMFFPTSAFAEAAAGSPQAAGTEPVVKFYSNTTDAPFLASTPEEGRTQGAAMSTTGSGAQVSVSGNHTGDGEAYVYNVIYDGLSIPVEGATRLSYHITPNQPTYGYDYNYYSMYVAVDLKFSDGTYLSELGVPDQNDVLLDPKSQGKGLAMVYGQDNLITSSIGEYVAGKTIEKILVGYHRDTNPKGGTAPFSAKISQIKLEDTSPVFETLADYVNILRGTNNVGPRSFSRGLTGPMVAVPHGFNFWAPTTPVGDNNDIYGYTSTSISGFRSSHEPSVWIGERGDWTFMVNNGSSGSATFSHDNEVAKAHYYSVKMTGGKGAGTQVELTPTDHGVVVRFTYDKSVAKRGIELGNGASINQGAGTFTAFAYAGNNGMPRMEIYGEFNTPIESVDYRTVYFADSGEDQTVIEMRLATSFISQDQAKSNFNQEVKDKSFEQVMNAAKAAWNEKLGTIEIEGATEEQMITFYSNMYRLFLYPNSMAEYTGEGAEDGWQYRSPHNQAVMDGKLYYNNGFWDTYRTTWAAYALLTPSMDTEMLNGLVYHFRDRDWIPRWIAPGGSDCMVGTSSDVIFGDALNRGINFDLETAYKASLKNGAMSTYAGGAGGRNGLDRGIFLGYTTNSIGEGMSWSLEGYINDYGIAQMAKALGDEDNYKYYMNRALNYVKLFDSKNGGWFRGRSGENETWSSAVNPIRWGGDYTETNAWNMAFTVPHDGQGLANLYGGREALAAKLDQFFATPGDYNTGSYGGTIHEMREAQEVKMGQYGHSNQPAHHIPYMYNYAGRPDRTQETVRQVLRQCYIGSRIGQGYIGDEDNGEMSAWYIFSALGFYPVNMGSGEYAIGSPLFKKATINLENGNKIVVNAPNNSRDNIYVKNVKLNGVNHNKTYFTHKELVENGAVIDFEMTNTPSSWGSDPSALPPSLTEGDDVAKPLVDLVKDGTATSAGASNLSSLFDNYSKSSMYLTTTDGAVSIQYSFKDYACVEMYTLTSGKSKGLAPANFALYGSKDGENWDLLDERENEVFDWKTYTRPFAVADEKVGKYLHYRLDITGAGDSVELAEFELIGNPDAVYDRELLNEVIASAERVDMTGKPETLANMLKTEIVIAKEVAANESATYKEFEKAIKQLQTAVSKLGSLENFWTLLDGVKAIDTTGKPPLVSLKSGAVAAAEAVMAKTEITATELESAMNDLNKALSELKGLDEFWTLIAKAKAIDTIGKPTALVDLLTRTIQEAETVANNAESTVDELKAAKAKLTAALPEIESMEEFWTLIAEAKAIDTTGKPAALVDLLTRTIQEAEAVANKADATVEEMKAAKVKLAAALPEINNLESFWTLIAEAKAYDTTGKPAVMQGLLDNGVAAAEAVANRADATIDDLKAAKAALQDVLNEVKGLQSFFDLIDTAKAMDTEGKPEVLVQILTDAIADAEEVSNNPQATIQDIQDAKAALQTAINRYNVTVRDGYENPFEAESFNAALDIVKDRDPGRSGGYNIGGVQHGEWVKYNNVYFSGNGAVEFTACYASSSINDEAVAGRIDIVLDDLNNPAVGSLPTHTTGYGWQNYVTESVKVDPALTGLHDVYLRFYSQAGKYVANVDYVIFTQGEDPVETYEISGALTADMVEDVTALEIKLYAAADRENPLQTVHPDADGTYAFEPVVPGDYVIVIDALESTYKGLALPVTVADADLTDIALELLEDEVDRTALRALIAAVDGKYEQDRFTVESWSALTDALDAAKETVENPDATQKEIFAAYLELVKARDGLQYAADGSLLALAVELAQDVLENGNLNGVSKDRLQKAIDDATELLADETATQEQINAMYLRVMTAITTSMERVEREDLTKLIAFAQQVIENNLENEKYKPSTIAALEAALEEVIPVEQDDDATEDDIKSAYKTLSGAVTGLKEMANKAAFEGVYQTALELLETGDEATLADLEALMERAGEIREDKEVDQADVDQMAADLTRAMAKVRLKQAIEAARAQIEEFNLEEYTEESVAAVEKLIAAAEELAESDELDDQAADSMIKTLSDAPSLLVKKAETPDPEPDHKPSKGGSAGTVSTDDYWLGVKEKIEAAADGAEVSAVLTKGDMVPASVIDALNGKNVTLKLSIEDKEYLLVGTSLKGYNAAAVYYTAEELKAMASDAPAEAAAPSASPDAASNPETGGEADPVAPAAPASVVPAAPAAPAVIEPTAPAAPAENTQTTPTAETEKGLSAGTIASVIFAAAAIGGAAFLIIRKKNKI